MVWVLLCGVGVIVWCGCCGVGGVVWCSVVICIDVCFLMKLSMMKLSLLLCGVV